MPRAKLHRFQKYSKSYQLPWHGASSNQADKPADKLIGCVLRHGNGSSFVPRDMLLTLPPTNKATETTEA